MAKHLEKFSYDNYDEDDDTGLVWECERGKPVNKKLTYGLSVQNKTIQPEFARKGVFVVSSKSPGDRNWNNQRAINSLSDSGFGVFGFLAVASVSITILIGTAIWLNKDYIALEIFKFFAGIFTGGFAGYGLQKRISKMK